MASPMVAADDYWGYLITPDKCPTPVFEELLLGIANYINIHVAPWDTQCLTPTKLATFYRLVGGNYDELFLNTTGSLSFIYQSLGCYHTLQPEKDPFSPPTLPALTPQGFVRWQTVQLLLEPEEHVPFLQEAVKRFEIKNPSDGSHFPRFLPKEAFPRKPDMVMVEWHESVSDRLRLEAQALQARNLPIALSDGEAESSTASSIEDQSIGDVAGYVSHPSHRSSIRAPSHPISSWAVPPHAYQYRSPLEVPWSPEHQRNTIPSRDNPPKPLNLSSGSATPISSGPGVAYIRHHRPRSPSTNSSASSSSSSSSPTTSSASLSPVLHTKDDHRSPHLERRHSTSFPYDPCNPTLRPTYRSQATLARPQTSYFPSQSPLYPPPLGHPRPNAKGLNVRWRDVDSVAHLPIRAPGTPDEIPGHRFVQSHPSGEQARSERRSGTQRDRRQMASPLRGVGGRRYATEGVSWRKKYTPAKENYTNIALGLEAGANLY